VEKSEISLLSIQKPLDRSSLKICGRSYIKETYRSSIKRNFITSRSARSFVSPMLMRDFARFFLLGFIFGFIIATCCRPTVYSRYAHGFCAIFANKRDSSQGCVSWVIIPKFIGPSLDLSPKTALSSTVFDGHVTRHARTDRIFIAKRVHIQTAESWIDCVTHCTIQHMTSIGLCHKTSLDAFSTLLRHFYSGCPTKIIENGRP